MSDLTPEEYAALLMEEQDNARFFYSTHTPHEWSSGPSVHYYNPETGAAIASLEEARELALKARRGTPGFSGYVTTSYGMSCEVSAVV